MRTAISYLDKVSSFTDEITVENVVKALGISDYESLRDLLYFILNSNAKLAVEIVEKIYNQGKDLKLFIKQFIQFILDVCKYQIYNSYDYIQIPNTIEIGNDINYNLLLNILDEIIELSNQIKYEQNPKVLIESKILMLCKGE
jgi:DNA polymerase-3 subunit gamma/tau